MLSTTGTCNDIRLHDSLCLSPYKMQCTMNPERIFTNSNVAGMRKNSFLPPKNEEEKKKESVHGFGRNEMKCNLDSDVGQGGKM